MNIRRMAIFAGICVSAAGMAGVSAAQQKTQSVAEAARKAAEQQKQSAPKTGVVWTNDNLPTSATVSVVGQVAAVAAQPNASATDQQAADPRDADSDRDKVAAELAAAKKELASAKVDLDLAQREYKLDSDQFYSMPNYSANQQGQAKLDADKSQVSAKQQAVDAAQKKVNELQKQLDELNAKLKAETTTPKS